MAELRLSSLEVAGSSSLVDKIVIYFVTSDRACALHLGIEGSNLLMNLQVVPLVIRVIDTYSSERGLYLGGVRRGKSVGWLSW